MTTSTATTSPTTTRAPAIGAGLTRLDGPAKVTGTAPYADEHPGERPVHLHVVQSTIAAGRITAIDTRAAAALPGVLTVLTHDNAPRLADTDNTELAILQTPDVLYRGQPIAAVVAESSEIARHAAGLVRTTYDQRPHDVVLRPDHDRLYAPESINSGMDTDTDEGDVEAALARASVVVDATYTTPPQHNNPLEPHTTVALWDGSGFTLHASTQGTHTTREAVATAFGLAPQQVRVIAPHVGGGFGSKGVPHPDAIVAALAAQAVPGRSVRFPITRQQMFDFVGYRPPTIQRMRMGADPDGRLTALWHQVVEQSSTVKEYAEQTASPSRSLYAAANRRTSHRIAPLDVAAPSWMRAPGEMPGMVALESAMDELAIACGLDPIELRIRNEPDADPETGLPWSTRNLIACMREGARRVGWEDRDPTPGVRRDGRWLIGSGMAAAAYPVHRQSATARIRHLGEGRFAVEIAAEDIGTGAWTVLTQIAADALSVPVEAIDLRIGSTDLPKASVAGGSSGTTTWGSAIVQAASDLTEHFGTAPPTGAEVQADTPDNTDGDRVAMYAFGAHFIDARVDADSGEVRIPRMTGVFAIGNVINPVTARSQLLGGMTMGLSTALHEESLVDGRLGHVINHDLAGYHIATNADVGEVDISWIEEDDPHVNPMGAKGIGEIGIVGTGAAIANAVHHATGIRVRDLPITPAKLLQPGGLTSPQI